MPPVSIIVTTYNRPEFLKKTLQSILNQTYTDFELIVVDNFSNYNFFSLIESFGDKRIYPFQNENYGIIATNRNFGIKKSTGELLAFCDDDDCWVNSKLEMQIEAISEKNADFCCTAMTYIDENDNRLYESKVLKKSEQSISLKRFLKSSGFIYNSTVIFHKKLISRIGLINEDPKLVSVEDYEFFSRMLLLANSIYIPEPLVRYRKHTASTTANVNLDWIRKQFTLNKVLYKQNKKYRLIIIFRNLKMLIQIIYFKLHKKKY